MEDPGLARNAQPAGQNPSAVRPRAMAWRIACQISSRNSQISSPSHCATYSQKDIDRFRRMRQQLGERVEGVDGLRRARFVISQRAAAQAVDLPGSETEPSAKLALNRMPLGWSGSSLSGRQTSSTGTGANVSSSAVSVTWPLPVAAKLP